MVPTGRPYKRRPFGEVDRSQAGILCSLRTLSEKGISCTAHCGLYLFRGAAWGTITGQDWFIRTLLQSCDTASYHLGGHGGTRHAWPRLWRGLFSGRPVKRRPATLRITDRRSGTEATGLQDKAGPGIASIRVITCRVSPATANRCR